MAPRVFSIQKQRDTKRRLIMISVLTRAMDNATDAARAANTDSKLAGLTGSLTYLTWLEQQRLCAKSTGNPAASY
jgi:hypothetical protein